MDTDVVEQSLDARLNLDKGATFSEQHWDWAVYLAVGLLAIPAAEKIHTVPYGFRLDIQEATDCFIYLGGEKKLTGVRLRDNVRFKDITFRIETTKTAVSQMDKYFAQNYCHWDLTINIDPKTHTVLWAVLLDLNVLRANMEWIGNATIKDNKVKHNRFVAMPVAAIPEEAIIARYNI